LYRAASGFFGTVQALERMLQRYVAPLNRSDVVRFQFDQRVTARITPS